MYSLFLDTTQKYCHIIIFNKKKIIGSTSTETNNNLTDIVVEYIDQLIKKCKVNYQNIKSLYCLLGPGSFTGVRVNTIIAKTWYHTRKTKIFTMDSLHFQIPTPSGISVLDARGNKWYVCVVKNNKTIVRPKMIDSSGFNQMMTKFKGMKIYKYFDNIDISKNLIFHINDFKPIKNIKKLEPLYIKKAI